MAPVQKTLADYYQIHRESAILVCGCGESLLDLPLPVPEKIITIGVNDIGRRFTPDYLIVLNPANQFIGDRWQFIRDSQAKEIFSSFNLDLPRSMVKVMLGNYLNTRISALTVVLNYANTSTWSAAFLAGYMGAIHIGLIGVDFTEGHFWGDKELHELDKDFDKVEISYGLLHRGFEKQGIEVVNLSEKSRLTALPKIALNHWLQRYG